MTYNSETGSIEWAKDDKEASYLSLFQNLALGATLLPEKAAKKYPMGIPYDYACPSTKECLSDRLCNYCGMYFGTIKSKQQHSTACKPKPKESKPNEKSANQIAEVKKVRPQRVAARRQREILCVMAYQELEWHAMDDVDFEGLDDIREIDFDIGTPVLDNVDPIWTNSV